MFSKITAILVMRLPVFPRELVTCAIVFQLCRSWTEKADFVAYNKLTTGLRHDLGIFARISKFHCFHETKQTQNEVERFFLQLGRICFRILLRQSENFSDFCKVLSQFAFRNMIVPFYTSSSARALKLPSISHTSFLT